MKIEFERIVNNGDGGVSRVHIVNNNTQYHSMSVEEFIHIVLNVDNAISRRYPTYVNKQKNTSMYSNKASKDGLKAIKESWTNLANYKTPTHDMCMEALKQNPLALQYISSDNVNYESYCNYALKYNEYAIKLIEKPTVRQCITAVRKNGSLIRYIENPDTRVIQEALKQNGMVLQWIKNPSEYDCEIAVSSNPEALQYVHNQGVSKIDNYIDMYGIVHVKKSYLLNNVCYIAVNKNPKTLRFIKQQNEDICMKAVLIDGMVLEYVKDKTPEICEVAIKQNPRAVKFL